MDFLDSFNDTDLRLPEKPKGPNRVTTKIHLTRDELRLCGVNAVKASLGGRSRIREDTERQVMLGPDQFAGQIGNAAGCKWWYGNLDDYKASREKANANPTVGDKGQDLLTRGVDFKLSLMRASTDPNEYRLLVRPEEKHPGWVYVQFFAPDYMKDRSLLKDGLDVWLAGWYLDADFPARPLREGPFQGVYVVTTDWLRPCGPRPDEAILNAALHL
jgi:hypothetical protein